jgi:hypothetical protein
MVARRADDDERVVHTAGEHIVHRLKPGTGGILGGDERGRRNERVRIHPAPAGAGKLLDSLQLPFAVDRCDVREVRRVNRRPGVQVRISLETGKRSLDAVWGFRMATSVVIEASRV